MEWLAIVGLVLALPVALISAVLILIWHLNAECIYLASKEAQERRVTGAK